MSHPTAVQTCIRRFLAAGSFAVVGASEDPAKFGHKCFFALLRHGRAVHPVNPNAVSVLGRPAYPTVSAVPGGIEAVSIVTPPQVTERVMEDVVAAGARMVWMQPGAESPAAIAKAREAGMTLIAGGPCLLVELARETTGDAGEP
jgi:uncharacterized protein